MRASPRANGDAAAAAVPIDEWPFIGRDHELDELGRSIVEGDCTGVVLAGPAGVGKTRLALESLDRAERAGLTTVRTGAARPSAGLPPGALAPLLPAADGRRPADRTRAVDNRADLLHRAAEALAARARERRVVLFVDDAHLLDDASATLVHQVAASRVAFVLVTVRTGEATGDPATALWKEGLADRIEVGGLPDDAVAALVSAAVGGVLDAEALTGLTARARGNILFLRELVIGAIADRVLVQDDGRWHLRGHLAPSERLIEIVEGRFRGLDAAERSLLELVAFGEPLGHAELSALADPALADRLERAGLLMSRTTDRRLEVRLAHPLYAEVVRARTPAARAPAIARALAAAVEGAGARRAEDALRVASWHLTGGGATPETLTADAAAVRWRDDVLAERLARAAVAAGAGFEAALLAAQLAGLQGRTDQAERELAALAAHAVDDDQRGQLALARIASSVAWTGEDELGIIDEAERTITDPRWRDALAAERVALLSISHGPLAAAEASRPLLERAEGPALVRACTTASCALSRLGRVEEALVLAARGRAAQIDTTTPLPWHPWWHSITRCLALTYAGRFGEVEAVVGERGGPTQPERSTEARALFALLHAHVAVERGHVGTAAAHAHDAAVLNTQLHRPVLVQRALIHQALALALGGRPHEATDVLAQIDALGLPPSHQHEVDLLQARAWAAAAAGDVQTAHHLLRRGAAVGNAVGDLVGRATALHGLARLGRAREAHPHLVTVTPGIEGELARARAAHTDALVRGDAAALDDVSRRFESLGTDLLAAEAAADGAVARRRAGEARAATAAEQRAAVLAERCEGATTPALRAVGTRVHLTEAEREAALLAATGLTSRQIAEKLCIAVRTVDNRLQRVYRKLGISRRTEITAALEA